MEEYMVVNKRLRNYLFSLGFDYTTRRDKKNVKNKVYIFNNNNKLQECISFYVKIHRESQQIKN